MVAKNKNDRNDDDLGWHRLVFVFCCFFFCVKHANSNNGLHLFGNGYSWLVVAVVAFVKSLKTKRMYNRHHHRSTL